MTRRARPARRAARARVSGADASLMKSITWRRSRFPRRDHFRAREHRGVYGRRMMVRSAISPLLVGSCALLACRSYISVPGLGRVPYDTICADKSCGVQGDAQPQMATDEKSARIVIGSIAAASRRMLARVAHDAGG